MKYFTLFFSQMNCRCNMLLRNKKIAMCEARVAQAVARLATTRMVGGSRPTPDARA